MSTPKNVKHYRPDSPLGHETITLLLNSSLVKAVEKIVLKEPDKNMSRYIEDSVKSLMPYGKPIPARHGYGESQTKKKTFTFSVAFVSMLKENGKNKSMVIETILADKLNIQL